MVNQGAKFVPMVHMHQLLEVRHAKTIVVLDPTLMMKKLLVLFALKADIKISKINQAAKFVLMVHMHQLLEARPTKTIVVLDSTLLLINRPAWCVKLDSIKT